MLWERVTRSAEKCFAVCLNSYSTAAITVGMPVMWDYATDADGLGVTIAVADHSWAAAGIVADTTIAAGAYGLIQVYGYNASAIIDGGTDVAAGDPVMLNTAAFELIIQPTASNAVVTVPCGFALAAITAATAAATAMFVKCL